MLMPVIQSQYIMERDTPRKNDGYFKCFKRSVAKLPFIFFLYGRKIIIISKIDFMDKTTVNTFST